MSIDAHEDFGAVRCGVTIRRLHAGVLRAGSSLFAERFGYRPEDKIPAWLMHTTNQYGGISLGAYSDEQLVGYSYAFPGFSGGRAFLFSCGLAVAPGFESLGIGEALKLAQRAHARRAGYEMIRWTTETVASRSLYLYLTKLGGRAVTYREDMNCGMLMESFPDEVEIEWDIRSGKAGRTLDCVPCPLIASERTAAGARRPAGVNEMELATLNRNAYSVEIPWNRYPLERNATLADEWLKTVRETMRGLLDAGFVGTAVVVDSPEERSFVRFDRTTS